MLNSTIPPEKAKNISPVTLAFVGDAVYSLYVREKLVGAHDLPAHELQKLCSADVSAHGQSRLAAALMSGFTEEEEAIFRRGRNAKKGTRAKHASVEEYNNSTGFEAVLGFLYLTGRYGRLNELLDKTDEN